MGLVDAVATAVLLHSLAPAYSMPVSSRSSMLQISASSRSSMLQMLDSMQHLMTGQQQYDRQTYKEFRECMAYLDPWIPAVQDRAWQGRWTTGAATGALGTPGGALPQGSRSVT